MSGRREITGVTANDCHSNYKNEWVSAGRTFNYRLLIGGSWYCCAWEEFPGSSEIFLALLLRGPGPAQHLERMESKVSHIQGQTFLHNPVPIKLWIPRFRWASLIGYALCILLHIIAGKNRCWLHHSTGRKQLGAPILGISRTLTYVHLSFLMLTSCNQS